MVRRNSAARARSSLKYAVSVTSAALLACRASSISIRSSVSCCCRRSSKGLGYRGSSISDPPAPGLEGLLGLPEGGLDPFAGLRCFV